jgi:hypothetical protein
MRIYVTLIIVLLLVATVACRSRATVDAAARNNVAAAPNLIAQADQFYAHRDDLKQLEQGIVLLREAAAADPNNYDANWRLAKFSYYLAIHTEGDSRAQAFREGINAGKTAVGLQPNKPDGHFWLGANYGGVLESETISGAASTTDLRSEMETVLKLDEGYQDGSAYMVLGLLDLKAPRIVGAIHSVRFRNWRKGCSLEKGTHFCGCTWQKPIKQSTDPRTLVNNWRPSCP